MTKMPWSVRLAIAALVFVSTAQVAAVLYLGVQEQIGRAQALFGVALLVLLVVGLARRWRLAWLWARWLGLFLSVVLAGVLAWNGRSLAPRELALGLLLFPLPLAVVGVALGRRSAFSWFRLVCPVCAARSGRGDLLLREVRCPTCGTTF